LIVPEKNSWNLSSPEHAEPSLIRDNPEILEGMRITFELMREMNETCQQQHIRFVVIVIPIKEEVFFRLSGATIQSFRSVSVIDKLLA